MGMMKKILSLIALLFLLMLLVLYWFIPQGWMPSSLPDYNTTNFSINTEGSQNFSEGNVSEMQFYKNLRFASNQITYSIDSCPVDRKQEIISALALLSSKTILNFIEVQSNPNIDISCEDKVIEAESGMFIAGEGGPTNITILKDYNLITHGKVLLLKSSKCSTPDIALHELLHALGFAHSPNPKNIMYPVSDCGQEFSEDIIDMINNLYSVEASPDLSIENSNAEFKNHYLNLNVTIKNIGLKTSDEYKLKVYVNNVIEENISYEAIEPGFGRTTILTNIFVSAMKIENIKLEIVHNSQELRKDNNILVLQ